MLWSLEELFTVVKYRFTYYGLYSFYLYFFKNMKFLILDIYKWITKGHTMYFVWDTRYVLLKSISNRVKIFHDAKKCGYPGRITSEKWDLILKEIYEKVNFDIINNNEIDQYVTIDEGLNLFSEWILDMWD